jgi:phospholipid-binding lipoprotein MlaA
MRAAQLIGVSAFALAGCASNNLTIRSLPPEMPAADNAAAVKNAAVLAAVETDASHRATDQDGAHEVIPLTAADAPSMFTYDPWERVNRFTYRFNARFDEAVFLPVANQYRRVPSPVRSGVHNFFANLSEVENTINFAIQLRPGSGARSLARFLINSTVGIGGLFDVATKLKLDSQSTGFTSALSQWGMHPGPYLIIPFLGPATLRDGVGMLADFGVSYAVNVAGLYRGDKTWALGIVDAIDARSNISFRYYGTGSAFEYETVRFLYVHEELIEDAALHAKNHPQARDVDTPAGK